MEAKDCGCRVEHRIEGSFTNRYDCRYPDLLAENAELKHCKECDTSGGYHETFCSKVLWACNHAHNLLNARDVLVPELTAKVEKLEQERDALACELEEWKNSGPDCGCPNVDPHDTGWGCYCCGVVFCDNCAGEHFGESESMPACKEKLNSLTEERDALAGEVRELHQIVEAREALFDKQYEAWSLAEHRRAVLYEAVQQAVDYGYDRAKLQSALGKIKQEKRS